MPAKRLSMRKIKEVLRLSASGMSNRKIARSLNQSRPSVANYLRRAADAGLKWPLPDWIGSHQRTFSFLGGVVEIVVPDNLERCP